MYRPEYNKNGTAKHSSQCKGSFGRYDLLCHRCLQLLHGKPPRAGWKPRKPAGQTFLRF